MDPNEVLETIRRLSSLYRNDGDWDENETHALIGHIEDLDEWLTKGGFLPQAWRRATNTRQSAGADEEGNNH